MHKRVYEIIENNEAKRRAVVERIPKLIEEQRQRKELALKKKSKLLEYNVTGAISDADFIAMNKQCAQEIADAEAQIRELEQQLYSKEEFRKQIETMKAVMLSMEQSVTTGAITKEFVDEFIDKILVTPENDHTMQLDIKIFTGEATMRYFEKLALRTGHTFKLINQPNAVPVPHRSIPAEDFHLYSRTCYAKIFPYFFPYGDGNQWLKVVKIAL